MRILITNDDGIYAPGLNACERIARELSDEVWIVAPESDQSGVSHSLSLNDPLRLREVGERHFAVKGTPTDCVIMGARNIMKQMPDLVLAGVNRGRNAAENVTYSGTVAGAMEGTVLGIPSFALSQPMPRQALPYWDTAIKFAPNHPSHPRCRHTARRWSTSIFPTGCRARSLASRSHAGQARPGAAAHRRGTTGAAIRITDRVRPRRHCRRSSGQRSRRSETHFGDAAAADLTDEPFMTRLAEVLGINAPSLPGLTRVSRMNFIFDGCWVKPAHDKGANWYYAAAINPTSVLELLDWNGFCSAGRLRYLAGRLPSP